MEQTWECGDKGDNVTAVLSEDGATLTIRGTGRMKDYVYVIAKKKSSSHVSVPWGGTTIANVNIEKGVTSIGSHAFHDCTGLKSVKIPSSVTDIGFYAFSNCRGLTSIDIPNSVTSIKNGAFSDCRSLTSINIPNSVTFIEEEAFSDCRSLTSINIPDSVTSIKNWAFGYCTSLKYVKIPKSVVSIKNRAFSNCRGLTSIDINSVTSIGKDAFYGCDKLPPDIKERIRSINEDAYLPDTIRDNNEDDNKNENKYKDENKKERLPRLPKPENKIFYGVPGSGKSHAIRSKIGEEKYEKFLDRGNIIRVVFHPDYTYSDFTGQILPRVGDNGAISYEFKPGPFTKILKAAVEREDEPFFLVIEEVNRGNAASIFGDLFQLLDRDDEGKSEYPVDNHEIGKIVYGKGDDDADIPKIHIPANLWLLATMNTSDQNVFALDTAFQRRWDMELIPNEFGEGQEFLIEGTGVTWGKFAKEVNGVLEEDDNGMMGGDKRLGAWFVKPDKKIDGKDALSRGRFANKVLKYLWDDAFKFNRDAFFNTEKYKTLEAVIKAVSDNDNVPDDLFKGINFDSP